MPARPRDMLPSAWVALPVLTGCLIAVLATMASGPVVVRDISQVAGNA